MTKEEFEILARNMLAELPAEFKDRLQNVDVCIEQEPSPDTVRLLKLGDKGRLLGLYQGIPQNERTHYYGMVLPDKITLYKRNIERECREHGLNIKKEIRQVIIHEIAHHFGITDQRLRDLDVY